MGKVIVTCALTGAQQGKEANPNLPEQPEEIIAQGLEAWRAGAAVLHIHARDAQGKATADVAVFRQIVDGLRSEGCDAVLNLTTGGAVAGLAIEERIRVRSNRTSHPLASVVDVCSVATINASSAGHGTASFRCSHPTPSSSASRECSSTTACARSWKYTTRACSTTSGRFAIAASSRSRCS